MQNHQFYPLLLILTLACVLSACQPVFPMQPAAAGLPPTPTAVQTTSVTASTVVPVKQLTEVIIPTQGSPKTVQETPVMNDVPILPLLDPGLQAIMSQVQADLAKRLAIDPSKIELVEVSSVTWSDSSLGCPKPGMAYAQVMVDGMRIRVKAGNQVYEYHSAGARPAFLCQE